MSDNTNPESSLVDSLTPGRVLGFVLLFLLIGASVLVMTYGWYLWNFGVPRGTALIVTTSAATASQQVQDAKAAWGQAGDFVGGVLNPFLAFLTFVAFALTLILQTRQVALSRTELHEAREERAGARQEAAGQLDVTRAVAEAQRRTADAQEGAARALQEQLQVVKDAAEAQLLVVRQQLEQATALSQSQARTAQAQESTAKFMGEQAQQAYVATRLASLNAQLTLQFELWRNAEKMRLNAPNIRIEIDTLIAELNCIAKAHRA
jgi:hypothetical protein